MSNHWRLTPDFRRVFHGALGYEPSSRNLFPYLPTALNDDDMDRITSTGEWLPGAIIDKFGSTMVLVCWGESVS